MTRVVEIFVLANAVCGITAFVIAKGLWKKGKRKLTGERSDTENDPGAGAARR